MSEGRKEKGICVNKHGKRRCECESECECECGVISDLHDSQEFCHRAHTHRERESERPVRHAGQRKSRIRIRQIEKSRNRYFIKIPNVAPAASPMSNSVTACMCVCVSVCVCVLRRRHVRHLIVRPILVDR